MLAVLGEEVARSEPMSDLVGDWLARLDADGDRRARSRRQSQG